MSDVEPVVDRSGPMTLWQAAYLWAETITDAAGRSRCDIETVRVLISYAITVEARHVPGLVPRSCLVESPAVLAPISMVTVMDRQLHTFLDALLSLVISHGAAPAPWEPGYAAFQALQDSVLQPTLAPVADGPAEDYEHVVALARETMTTVVTQLVTDAMTDVPLALLGSPSPRSG